MWHLGPDLSLGLAQGDTARLIVARQVILATGAIERPMPLPGWTLPGVMTVGAAQTLLKAQGLVPGGRTILVGSGPLVWQFAAQCLAVGKPPSLILDTTPRGNRQRALRHVAAFLASRYAWRGLALLAAVRRRVPCVAATEGIAIAQEGAGLAVTWPGGCARADLVLLHQGVVPNLQLALAAGCAVSWNAARACFEPQRDCWGRTSVPGIAIAGDAGGIEGAEAAEAAGRLAALGVLAALGAVRAEERDRSARPWLRRRARACRGRAFLDALFLPDRRFRIPEAETVLCRCEGVAAGAVREAAAAGARSTGRLKAMTRVGMGPCQGRMCLPTVVETLADQLGLAPAALAPWRIRSPVVPLPLAALGRVAERRGGRDRRRRTLRRS
ncbi:MAG: (2Fe-2S)-binding protein [Acetobacteraceae bacterium]|nr:(2Fe-2S)-binding protein [Acetobacteraceae bacterium]